MNFFRCVLAVGVLVQVAIPALAQRQTRELTTGWKFLRQDAEVGADTSTWTNVQVPHTWNNIDGQNGQAATAETPAGYYRGPAWYERKLEVPASWKSKRVFLRFEGTSLVSDVYLNGQQIGQHRGAFGAFCFELTSKLKFDGTDELRVKVNNARVDDVAPLSGDFTVFGGIYRPVSLFATDSVCVSPLNYASPGLYLTARSITAKDATVEAKTILSNGLSTPSPVLVETQIKDRGGKVVEKASQRVTLPDSATQTLVQNLQVKNPHLWNGRKDPYLYSATVRVWRGKTLLDEVTQPLGIRTVALTNERGFLLNGAPYSLHGVNRHQEKQDKGWALSNTDHDEDYKLIADVGATVIRLAHYPQSEYFQNLCDKGGMILWEEIPQVNETRLTPEFASNAETQLREMILQHGNHPSVAFWGLSNELNSKWANEATPELERQKALAHEMDATRPVVTATERSSEKSTSLKVPDWIGYNAYPGWYGGNVNDMTNIIERVSKLSGKRIAMSEYGAGANYRQHMEGAVGDLKIQAGGPFHPEEYQTFVHQRDWEQMMDNPNLWGTFIWAMFDFAVDWRNEGTTPGLNDKGLVSHDRKVKKDSYFFYKANWNPEPMTYIAARRMTPRKLPTTQVKVFSNCENVELMVNGISLGTAKPDKVHVFRWENVKLAAGKNRIQATGHTNTKVIKDECEWVLDENATP
ncbi:glycoside hydrolase family 2 protein [bacterium]|nr:MAG: glycoside hydrolase family 2 protein [bacterium]